jgi:hypothetical protein
MQRFELFLAAGAATLAAALATPASAGPCDVLLSFESQGGQIDQGTYDKVGAWLRANPTRTAGIVETAFSDGTRSLCVTAPTREDIRTLFRDMGPLVVSNELMPRVTLKDNRQQQRESKKPTRVRGTGYARDQAPPRGNGINNQPRPGSRY